MNKKKDDNTLSSFKGGMSKKDRKYLRKLLKVLFPDKDKKST